MTAALLRADEGSSEARAAAERRLAEMWGRYREI